MPVARHHQAEGAKAFGEPEEPGKEFSPASLEVDTLLP